MSLTSNTKIKPDVLWGLRVRSENGFSWNHCPKNKLKLLKRRLTRAPQRNAPAACRRRGQQSEREQGLGGVCGAKWRRCVYQPHCRSFALTQRTLLQPPSPPSTCPQELNWSSFCPSTNLITEKWEPWWWAFCLNLDPPMPPPPTPPHPLLSSESHLCASTIAGVIISGAFQRQGEEWCASVSVSSGAWFHGNRAGVASWHPPPPPMEDELLLIVKFMTKVLEMIFLRWSDKA